MTMNTSSPAAALSVAPGDAGLSDLASVLTQLVAATDLPFDHWDHAHAERVQQLSGWLQCAALWQAEDTHLLLDAPARSSAAVVRELLTAHEAMLARQRAEIAPFKAPDGSLLGEDYNDHDAVFDRHVEECVQMLGTVMAVLAGEFGRSADGPQSDLEPQGGPAAGPLGFTPPVTRER